jgi:hypothetical protein
MHEINHEKLKEIYKKLYEYEKTVSGQNINNQPEEMLKIMLHVLDVDVKIDYRVAQDQRRRDVK